jgi:predicted Zn-dependent protease
MNELKKNFIKNFLKNSLFFWHTETQPELCSALSRFPSRILRRHTSLKIISKLIFLSVFFSISLTFKSSDSYSQSVSLIRDAEVEKFLFDLSLPVIKAANLDEKNIKIFIVNDQSINAFVSGGQNIFINIGLITKYQTPDALIGVIAHEIGHISAGHLARSKEGAEEATAAMIMSYLLGIGAAAAGSPDAALALILGGNSSATRLYLKYNRTQEEAADLHAMKYLDEINYPPDGLIKLLEFFQSQMIASETQIDEYWLSHPISKKRIDAIKNKSIKTNFSNQKINEKLQNQMNWVLAKLEGFTADANLTEEKYRNQNDIFSKYKYAIALHHLSKSDQAIKIIDEIISSLSDKKNNLEIGFLLEVKGQFFFESGNIEQSILAYNEAIKKIDSANSEKFVAKNSAKYSAKYSAQAKIAFATAILSLTENDSELLNLAIKNLFEAKKYEENNPTLFYQISKSYAKLNDEGRSMLALAKFNCLIADYKKCQKYSEIAAEKLTDTKAEKLQAEDLIEESKKNISKK